MRSHVARAVLLALVVAGLLAPSTQATGVRASLDGRAIPLARVGDLACHDFEFPLIRCFDSAASLEADVTTKVTRRSRSPELAVAASGYVIVYEHAQYGGANPKVLSSDVAWLSDIGWNDKISSFKSFGASGVFYENSPNGGFGYYFGPTTRVPTLNSAYNDKFSSLYID
jgi:hypothetical protein